HISTKLKESTRAWGIPQGTIEESKQLTTLYWWSCYYTAGGIDLAPLRRGSELDDGRETSSSLSPVGVGVYLSVSQPRTKGPAAAPREKVKQLWRPTKHHHLRTTRSQAHA
ncbi:hypothetical protein Taro_050582, partial [Colocasia esculenta]|nr:hypothetical protein [Colocasia esculenta]